MFGLILLPGYCQAGSQPKDASKYDRNCNLPSKHSPSCGKIAYVFSHGSKTMRCCARAGLLRRVTLEEERAKKSLEERVLLSPGQWVNQLWHACDAVLAELLDVGEEDQQEALRVLPMIQEVEYVDVHFSESLQKY